MKTLKQLEKLIARSGGRMEEDEGSRDMRCLQACAPLGRIWAEGVLHFRVEWARGLSPAAASYNENQYKDLADRLSFGHRELTAEEKEMTAED